MHFIQPNDFTKRDVGVQAATIYASLDGFFEKNLCQAGDRLMADSIPVDDRWGPLDEIRERLILKGQPEQIDFVMMPATRIEGFLMDAEGRLLQGHRISLTGPELPPSCSVFEQVMTDLDGRFVFANVPADKQLQLSFTDPGSGDELLSANLDVSASRPLHRWSVAVSGNTATLIGEEIDEDRFEALAGRDIHESTRRRPVMRGRVLNEQESAEVTWGPEQTGLQAALRVAHGSVAGEYELQIWLRNVSNDEIVIESEGWRQDDFLRMTSLAGEQGDVLVAKTWYSGWPIIRNWQLAPGETVKIDCGNLWAGNEDSASDVHAVFQASPPNGDFQIVLDLRIPTFEAELADSWQGKLVTGPVRLPEQAVDLP